VYVIEKMPHSRNCSNYLQKNRAKINIVGGRGYPLFSAISHQLSAKARCYGRFSFFYCALVEGNYLQTTCGEAAARYSLAWGSWIP
jgi:hypothetical protein